MYELRQLGANTYVIEAPVNLGLFVGDGGRVALIDSGLDGDMGKRILRVLKERGWTLSTILCTHAHADHVGGGALLQARTGCRILSDPREKPFLEQDWLEGAMLWGGAPDASMRTKFTRSTPCRVDEVFPLGLPEGIEALPLPGHSPGMTALRTGDGVLFLGDAVLGEEYLQKHRLSYLYDPGAFLASLDVLAEQEAAWYVPGHAAPAKDIGEALQANRRHVMDVIAALLAAAKLPIGEEDLTSGLMRRMEVADEGMAHGLAVSTLRGYLTYLVEAGLMDQVFEKGRRYLIAAERGR